MTKYSLAKNILGKGVEEALRLNLEPVFLAHERMFRVLFDEGEISKSINSISRMKNLQKNF